LAVNAAKVAQQQGNSESEDTFIRAILRHTHTKRIFILTFAQVPAIHVDGLVVLEQEGGQVDVVVLRGDGQQRLARVVADLHRGARLG